MQHRPTGLALDREFSVRRQTRSIAVGTVTVGGTAPVSVQSMTNTDTRDADTTLEQIRGLAARGCQIVRVAVPDRTACDALRSIVSQAPVPVVADIHFDYRLALGALQAGAHCIRINPGNLRPADRLRDIAMEACRLGVPIRVGVNAGSLEEEILQRDGGVTAQGLADSALAHVGRLEKFGCDALKVSIKASSVPLTVEACRRFASKTDIPMHLGVTEAGSLSCGTVKSAAGIGALLLDGIGDTIRVSLTAPPEEEVAVGIRILEAVGLRQAHPEIVSCPTCGRTEIDLVGLLNAVERMIDRMRAEGYAFDLDKVAIMGCVVNGPGEARDADVGIAGGRGKGVLFKHGHVVRTLPEEELLEALLAQIRARAYRPVRSG